MNLNSRDYNVNWNFFRNNLTSLVDSNIPILNTKANVHLPWITRNNKNAKKKFDKRQKSKTKLGVTATGKGLGNFAFGICIPTLQPNGQIITNDHDKAHTFTKQFSFVLPQEIHPIPQLSPSIYSNIPFLEIGIDRAVKQLKTLNQNKATGPDELPARVLNETAVEIAPMIASYFQQSYNTSNLPDNWLQALITRIYKRASNQTVPITDSFN